MAPSTPGGREESGVERSGGNRSGVGQVKLKEPGGSVCGEPPVGPFGVGRSGRGSAEGSRSPTDHRDTRGGRREVAGSRPVEAVSETRRAGTLGGA